MARQGKIPMRSDGWNADYPDAENFMQVLYGPNIGQANDSRFNLPEFNRLFDEARGFPIRPSAPSCSTRMTELVLAYAPLRMTVASLEDSFAHPLGAQLRAAPDPLAELDVHRRRMPRRVTLTARRRRMRVDSCFGSLSACSPRSA